MKARDVMASPVITMKPTSTVNEAAQIFVERHISGAPVVDDTGAMVGIVSEGDLLHRSEAGTQRRRSWWLHLLTRKETLAADYIKEHARSVGDVMTRRVISASPDTPLREIARLLEKNRIKRVPIVENGRVVGIVSRANLIQALAVAPESQPPATSDSAISDQLIARLQNQPWGKTGLVNITVANGVVGLWGLVDSDVERRAVRVAAEAIPGVTGIEDHLVLRPFGT